MKNTTRAMITKFMIDARRAPQLMTIEPIDNVAVCHCPPGMNGVIMGIIRLFTMDWINVVAEIPIMNAIARGITLYSFRNSLNSRSTFFIMEKDLGRLCLLIEVYR